MLALLAVAPLVLLPLLSGEAAEPLVVTMPAENDAVQAKLARAGLPLTPSAAEVQALAPELRQQQASAIKRVLLLRELQCKADGYYTTPGNYMACAALAAKLGAPPAFVALLQVGAEVEDLSVARQDAMLQGLEHLSDLYAVDPMGIRLYAESNLATPEELADFTARLPLAALFNVVDVSTRSAEQFSADLDAVAVLYQEMLQLYTTITSPEQAQAAIPQMESLVARFGTVYPGLMLAPQHVQQNLSARYEEKILPLLPPLKEQRARVRDAAFYGNAYWRVLDSFID
ncbi:MAG: hypothetical protein E7033_06240 [Akkermansiaceae bacterium]|nr:hypothetical protein [Akkermansiaceae bacterium]